MNLQYIADSTGKTTGVFIPITDWEKLKTKFVELENELDIIPTWHKDILKKRLTDFQNNPEQVLNFDVVLDEIEKEL